MEPLPKIYVAGHRGLVGSALVRALEARGHRNLLTAHARRARPDRCPRHARVHPRRAARPRLHRRGQGRRHRRQQHLPGRLHPRQPGDPDRTLIHASFLAGVKRLMFLGSSCIYPKLAAAADAREQPAHRPARADQPSVRAGQDRRHRDVLELQPPARHEVPGGDADQPLRAGRQLPPDQQPRHPGAAAQVPRGEAARRRGGDGLGHRHAEARVHVQRRHGRGVRAPDAACPTTASRRCSAATRA